MAEQSALDVVLAYQEAWTSKDLETAARYLAVDMVFDGPALRYDSAEAFLPGLRRFVDQIAPGWKKIAALADDDVVLLMYEVFLPSGSAIRCADAFDVRDGRIQAETLVFDTLALRAAQPAPTASER